MHSITARIASSNALSAEGNLENRAVKRAGASIFDILRIPALTFDISSSSMPKKDSWVTASRTRFSIK